MEAKAPGTARQRKIWIYQRREYVDIQRLKLHRATGAAPTMGMKTSEYKRGVYDAQHFDSHVLDSEARRQREQAAAKHVLQQSMRARRKVFGQTMRDPRQVFRAIDRDGSGTVSPAELANALKRLGLGLTDAQLTDLTESLDTDGAYKAPSDSFRTTCSRFRAVEARVYGCFGLMPVLRWGTTSCQAMERLGGRSWLVSSARNTTRRTRRGVRHIFTSNRPLLVISGQILTVLVFTDAAAQAAANGSYIHIQSAVACEL